MEEMKSEHGMEQGNSCQYTQDSHRNADGRKSNTST